MKSLFLEHEQSRRAIYKNIQQLLSRSNGLKCLYYGEDIPLKSIPEITLSQEDAYLKKLAATEQAKWMVFREKEVIVNASSMPTICGNNFFETPDKCALMRSLKGTRFFDSVAHQKMMDSNVHISRGRSMEPIAKKCFERVTGMQFMDIPSVAIFTNPHVFGGLLGGTPDGFVNNGRQIVEIKCPKKCTKAAQKNYADQVQSYMHLFDVNECFLFQYTSETDYMLQTIARDESWIETRTPHVEHFINCVDYYRQAYRESLFETLNQQ